jgi:predicted cupin superfamily sugar epimerase
VPSADDIIRILGLVIQPQEGGYYRETWRSNISIPLADLPVDRYRSRKACGTAIYYLLTPQSRLALHRLPTDEMFHFYLGDPVLQVMLHADGRSELVTLGQDLMKGFLLQSLVPAGTWQGAVLVPGGQYGLMGTTVAPGFDFSDYVEGNAEELALAYPDQAGLIRRLR